jgi:hypothetical protein
LLNPKRTAPNSRENSIHMTDTTQTLWGVTGILLPWAIREGVKTNIRPAVQTAQQQAGCLLK